jgi:hypothetical protein
VDVVFWKKESFFVLFTLPSIYMHRKGRIGIS